MKKIVVLVSGGVDSTILAAYTKKMHPDDEVKLIHYDYGHPFEYKEREALPEGTIIRRFDWLDPNEPYTVNESDPAHLPGRDFAMITQAMIQEDPDRIYLGLLHGEMNSYLDQSYEFYYRLNHLLSVVSPSGKRVEVEAPFEARGFDKKAAIQWALNNGFTAQKLADTSSCMNHLHKKCGVCPVCIRRWLVFNELGLLKYEGDTVFSSTHTISHLYNKFLRLMVMNPTPSSSLLDGLKAYFGTEDYVEIDRLINEKLEKAKS